MNIENKRTSPSEGAVRTYAAITSITGAALFGGSLCSLTTILEEDRIAKGTHIKNNINKFTALCAALFGAELLGGLLWQKAQEKKADSFKNRIEQEKLKAPEISASR